VGVGLAVVLAVAIWSVVPTPARLSRSKVSHTSSPAVPPVVAPALALSTTEIARRAMPSTVSLRCADSLGSGFLVAEDLVLTNAHVLCGGESRINVVFENGRELAGQVVRSDPTLDLAVVQVKDAGVRPLPLGDVGTLSVGDKLVMIGSPVGLEFTVHEGAVSNLSHAMLGVAYIQIEAKVNPGNSGGPLLDSQGRVVGIVTLKQRNAEGIGFALPINYACAGESPLVAGVPASASARFAEMQALAEAQVAKTAQEVSSLALLPVLVGAHVDQYQRLVVSVLQPARSMPPFQDVTLYVRRGRGREVHAQGRRGGVEACRTNGHVRAQSEGMARQGRGQ
jgi:Trypsin-like peptidase domain